jgi:hypothetical protein
MATAGPIHVTRLSGVPIRKVNVGPPAPLSVCRAGQDGDPVGVIGGDANTGIIFFGEDDTYWTFVSLDSCPDCQPGYTGALNTAHLALYFPFAPETVTVSVNVVRAGGVVCRQPDYIDPALFGPQTFTFDCQDSLALVDFGMALPPGWELSRTDNGAAFLGFNFISANDTTAAHKPQLAVQANARPCLSWNQVGFTLFDMVGEYGVGNPVMYAEVNACWDPVPVRRHTWGELKLLYR